MTERDPESPRRPPSPTSRSRALPLGRQLLVLFAVFSLGPLFVSNVWGYVQTRSRLGDAAFRDVQNVASIEASQARRSVVQKRELIASLIAGNQHIFSLLRSSATCSPDAACASVRRAIEAHLRAKQAESRALELVVVSIDEVVLGSSTGDFHGSPGPTTGVDLPAPTPQPRDEHSREQSASHDHGHPGTPSQRRRSRSSSPASTRPCFTAIRRADRIALETDDAQPVLVVAHTVVDATGEALGYLCGRFEFDVHRFLMATTEERTASAVSFLLDENGEVICSSLHHQGNELGTRPGMDLGQHPRRAPWAERTPDGVLAAFAPVPDLPWGILVELPVSVALTELETLKWQAIGFGTLLGLVLMVVAVVASRRVARPLKRLAELASRATEGSLGVPLHPEGPKEVVDLANAFNEMSVALRESHHQLEDRIVDRTRELDRNRRFLEHLLDSIDRRVLVVNAEKVIIKANRAASEVYGAVVGEPYGDVFEQDLRGEDPVLATIRTGVAQVLERAHGSGAAQTIVRVELFPVRLDDGTVNAVIEIATDVTADKRLQAQVMHHERMATLGLLAAGMAHDIGNPLASILGQLRMTREVGGEERMRESLDVVEREIQRIARQLHGFVALSRRRRDVHQRLDINAMVQDVVTLLGYDPRTRGCATAMQLSRDLPPVRAQEDLVVQILLNLCINALDAMDGGGRLVISTTARDDWVAINVEDTGPGIPSHVRERIFDALVSTKPEERGTGLGLFMARNIAESLGAKLTLVSTHPGGTVFELLLRVAREEAP